MTHFVCHELEHALPPYEIARWTDARALLALDAIGAGGWGARDGIPRTQSMLVADPEICFRGGLSALRESLRWLHARSERSPYEAGLVGFLAYELGDELEPLWPLGDREPSARAIDSVSGFPTVWLAGFRASYRFDAVRRRGWVVGEDPVAARKLADRVQAGVALARSAYRDSATAVRRGGPPPALVAQPRSPLDEDDRSEPAFRRGVHRILEWIRAGDVYQVNLARRVALDRLGHRAHEMGTREVYRRLCRGHPAPFCALLETEDGDVLSNSPERFLLVRGRAIETCPIKGTRPRAPDREQDQRLAKSLLDSAKDQAEHLMIVDLERNDLGRISEIGSVRVRCLAELRSYSTVHHLVSTVEGTLRAEVDTEAVLAATFPGGSITGAPKLRARQIIHALEPVPRGVYTGAIGAFDASGGIDLSIAIRTAVLRPDGAALHVGGGIVADSDVEEELLETRIKARAFSTLWGTQC